MNDVALARDFRRLVEDAEALMQHAVQGAGQDYVKARHRVEQTLLAARDRLASLEEAAVTGAVDAATASDRYVRRHPWESIGIGAAVGLVLGLLIGRK